MTQNTLPEMAHQRVGRELQTELAHSMKMAALDAGKTDDVTHSRLRTMADKLQAAIPLAKGAKREKLTQAHSLLQQVATAPEIDEAQYRVLHELISQGIAP